MSKIKLEKYLPLALGLKTECFNWGFRVVVLFEEISVDAGNAAENKWEPLFKVKQKKTSIHAEDHRNNASGHR